MRAQPKPFQVKDCALLAIATGRQAQNTRELRDLLQAIGADSIYYHFWGGLLRPKFDDPEYNNDFAAWARHGLHDHTLAERLAVVDPTEFGDLEALRTELVEVVEARLDETEYVAWARPGEQFSFIRAQIVVFDTAHLIREPEALAEEILHLSLGSIYYHFIDARRRTPDSADDFRTWLAGFRDAYGQLQERLASVDYYFVSLSQLRAELAGLVQAHFQGAAQA